MSIFSVFSARRTPRYKRRKVARFLARLTPMRELVAMIFMFGVLAGFCVAKLIGLI